MNHNRRLDRTVGKLVVFLGLLAVLCAGCTPRVIVRKSPTDQDRGVRYYRPKPYLKIEPAEVLVDKNQSNLVPGLKNKANWPPSGPSQNRSSPPKI